MSGKHILHTFMAQTHLLPLLWFQTVVHCRQRWQTPDFRRGNAITGQVSAFANEATTDEPTTVTVNYDKLTGPTYNTSLSATADTNNVAFPAYYDGSDIRAMSLADYLDTFIYATFNWNGIC